jgi:serine/threonine-protein kinase RsbW
MQSGNFQTRNSNLLKYHSTYKLNVKSSTENLAEVRNFVAEHAEKHGFTPKQISDIRLAVDEAFTNIIKHAYQKDDSKPVYLELLFDDEKLCVLLSDQGNSFKARNYKLPDIKEQIKKKKRGGMGVYLIHTLMDSVTYKSDSGNGSNEIRMCKKRV